MLAVFIELMITLSHVCHLIPHLENIQHHMNMLIHSQSSSMDQTCLLEGWKGNHSQLQMMCIEVNYDVLRVCVVSVS